MRTIVKLIMLLAVLAICIPAQGEILIYSKTIKCWEATEGEGWAVVSETIKGYLVLDVVYDENGEIDEVIYSYQVEYGKNDDGDKEYSEIEHNFDIVRVVDGNTVTWVLVEANSGMGGGEMTMVKGKAKYTNIGNDDPNEVAQSLAGNQLASWDEGSELAMCTWSLRLQKNWTKWSNEDGGDTIWETLDNIEEYLEGKGYDPEPV